MRVAASLLIFSVLPTSVLGRSYFLTENIIGPQFLTAFTHETIPDPTHGRVNYLSQAAALAKNLTYISGDTLILRADSTTVLDPLGPGRDSFRLQSNKLYDKHVAVWNIRHMPQGCSTWPAIWEVGPDWPAGGEIDIVEGNNDKGPNQSTLHTVPGCTMPSSRNQSGTIIGDDCYTNSATYGCGVMAPRTSSFGPSFNAVGGGWYAMERSESYIRIWHWQRNDTSIPMDIRSGFAFIDTSNWGMPIADFPNTNCDMARYFRPQRMIVNLSFCGDWAGAKYAAYGCPGECTDFVNRNPSAFKNAYFDIAWLKVYQ
uniref:Mixed-linked glucanase n=1 Tax=Ganoderma boninense TaxID=34458 RepID=A0A5K1JT67_9APHY|nr:Mixed-linked glucanase [Ganoderma boninense]